MNIQEKVKHWRVTIKPGMTLTSHRGEVMRVTKTTEKVCVLGVESYTWEMIERYIRTSAIILKA